MVINTYKLLDFTMLSQLLNWSVVSPISIENAFEDAKQVRIGDLLKRNKDIIEVENGSDYMRVTIRLYNKGVCLRDRVNGVNIGTKRQSKIKAGQFMLSKIDARNGAFGIVPEELNGAIVTNDFLAFDIREDKVNPQYLLKLLSSERFQKLWQSLSSGATNRQRINEDQFLNKKIYIPSLKTQEHIIDKYKESILLAESMKNKAARIEEGIENIIFSELGIGEVQKETLQSHFKLLNFKHLQLWGVEKNISLFNYNYSRYRPVSFSQKPSLIEKTYRGKSPKYDIKGKSVILNQKCNRTNSIELEHAKNVDDIWFQSIDKDYLTREGDILINSTGEGTIGRASYITQSFAGYLFDSHMLLLRVSKEKINPLFLVYQFNSSYVQDQIEYLKSAQATKQTELGIDNLKKIQFILPELSDQASIAEKINNELLKSKYLKEAANNLVIKANLDFEGEVFGEVSMVTN